MLTEYTDYAEGPSIVRVLKDPDNTIINNRKLTH